MSKPHELVEFMMGLLAQLETFKALPEILNKLENFQSNEKLINLILLFCKSKMNKDFNSKEKFKLLLMTILENVWEARMENYFQYYQENQNIIKAEDTHLVESKNDLDLNDSLKVSQRKEDFFERQNFKYRKNFRKWKKTTTD